MQKRKPIVAGQFYPGQHDSCIDEINECLDARTLSEPLPEAIVAGIVPHAGWTFSGSLAAMVFSAIVVSFLITSLGLYGLFKDEYRYLSTCARKRRPNNSCLGRRCSNLSGGRLVFYHNIWCTLSTGKTCGSPCIKCSEQCTSDCFRLVRILLECIDSCADDHVFGNTCRSASGEQLFRSHKYPAMHFLGVIGIKINSLKTC